jgi:hypothetical protein
MTERISNIEQGMLNYEVGILLRTTGHESRVDLVAIWTEPVDLGILCKELLDLFAGQKHGGVVFITKEPAYFRR